MLIDYLPEQLRRRWNQERQDQEEQEQALLLELHYHFPRLQSLVRAKRSIWLSLAAERLAEASGAKREELEAELAQKQAAYLEELRRVAAYVQAAEPRAIREGLIPPSRKLLTASQLPELAHTEEQDWADFPLSEARDWLSAELMRQEDPGIRWQEARPALPLPGSAAYRELLARHLEETGLGKQLEGSFATYDLGIFPESERRTMQGLRRMLERYCENFESPLSVRGPGAEPASLILWGPPGTGKSFAAQAVVLDLLERGWDVVYLNATELFLHFRDYERQQTSYRPDPERLARVEYVQDRLRQAELLVVDDLGRELKASSGLAQTDALVNLLDLRRQERRPCIFTSNFSNRKLKEEVYDGRVFSRLASGFRSLHLKGPEDLRIRAGLGPRGGRL